MKAGRLFAAVGNPGADSSRESERAALPGVEACMPRLSGGVFDQAPFMVFGETTRACDPVCGSVRRDERASAP